LLQIEAGQREQLPVIRCKNPAILCSSYPISRSATTTLF